MLNRIEASAAIVALVGGKAPQEGDTLIFRRGMWELDTALFLGILQEDPDIVRHGMIWFNATESKMKIQIGESVFASPVWEEDEY